MDLENLSDNEIRQQLTALGQSVGPLTPSTRTVYLKKLRNLLQMQGDAPVNPPTPPLRRSLRNLTEEESSAVTNNMQLFEDEEELTQLRDDRTISGSPKASRSERISESPKAVRSEKVSGSPKAKAGNRSPQLSFDDGSDGEMGGHESVRYLSPEEMELETSYNRSFAGSPVVPTPGSIKKVLLALCLLTMVVFVFYLSDRVHRQTASRQFEEEL